MFTLSCALCVRYVCKKWWFVIAFAAPTFTLPISLWKQTSALTRGQHNTRTPHLRGAPRHAAAPHVDRYPGSKGPASSDLCPCHPAHARFFALSSGADRSRSSSCAFSSSSAVCKRFATSCEGSLVSGRCIGNSEKPPLGHVGFVWGWKPN